jgi:RNA polymerase sigma factor for flagellar operon FliA
MTNQKNVDALIAQNLRLVDKAIFSLHVPGHADLAALKSAGLAGLHEAARKFDPSKRYSFQSFALRTLRFRLRDAMRSLGGLSRDGFQARKKIATAEAELTQELCRTPNEVELAEALGVTGKEFEKMRRKAAGSVVISIDETAFSDGVDTFHDIIPEVCSALEQEDAETVLGYVRQAVDAMAQGIERTVIIQSYFHGTPLAKLAPEYGLTESRIVQIRQSGTKKLRKHFVAIVRRDGQPDFTLPKSANRGGPRK